MPAAEPILEGVAPHEGHNEEGDSVARVEVVHAHDVGMVEAGAESGFATETLLTHGARRDFGRQDFDRDDVAQRAVASPKHRAHAAGTDET